MKKTLAVLSTTAIMMTSLSSYASVESLANIMGKYEGNNSTVSALEANKISTELAASLRSGDITTNDLKSYLELNVGPKAKKAISLLEKAENGQLKDQDVSGEFSKAIQNIGGGANFLSSRSACPTVGYAAMWVALGSGIMALKYGFGALGTANDIRALELSNSQARMKIDQINNDPAIPAMTITNTLSDGGSTSKTSVSGNSSVTTTRTTTTTTVINPPSKEELIAQQQRQISANNIDLLQLHDEYSYETKMLGVTTGLTLVSGGISLACGYDK